MNLFVKKNRLIFSFLILTFICVVSCSKHPRYADSYVIKKNGLYGLIDSLGNEIVNPRFIFIEPIQKDGVALAILDTIYTTTLDSTFFGICHIPTLNIKYGYVTKEDKFIFANPSIAKIRIYSPLDSARAYPTFCQNFSFYGGLAIAQDTTSYKYGYIRLNGDTIIPAKYHQARIFNQGRAAVQGESDGKSLVGMNWGLIDPDDQKVCDFVFSFLDTPFNGRAIAGILSVNKQPEESIEGEIAKDHQGTIYIDKSKSKKIEASDSPIYTTNVFLVDNNGKVIKEGLNMLYYYSSFSKDGIAVASPSDLGKYLGVGFKFINKDGEFIHPLDPTNITDKQAQEILESKFFLHDLLPADIEFTDATRFTDGYAAVNLGRGWIFVDSKLIPRGNDENPVYEDALPFSYGLAGVKLNGKYGYINKEFDIVIPCKYDSCAIAGRNLCRVYSGERKRDGFSIVSYINRDNNVVWQNIDYRGNYFEDTMEKQNGVWKEDISYVYIGKDFTVIWLLLILAICVVLIICNLKRNKRKNTIRGNNLEIESMIKNDKSPETPIVFKKIESSKDVHQQKDVTPLAKKLLQESQNNGSMKTIDERLNDILGF